jgi:hypothetical protein
LSKTSACSWRARAAIFEYFLIVSFVFVCVDSFFRNEMAYDLEFSLPSGD